MTVLEPVIVLSKLDIMMKYLDSLKRFEFVILEEYLDDFENQLIVERLLKLIIQVAIDINRYLLRILKVELIATN